MYSSRGPCWSLSSPEENSCWRELTFRWPLLVLVLSLPIGYRQNEEILARGVVHTVRVCLRKAMFLERTSTGRALPLRVGFCIRQRPSLLPEAVALRAGEH